MVKITEILCFNSHGFFNIGKLFFNPFDEVKSTIVGSFDYYFLQCRQVFCTHVAYLT